jgi:acetylornithine deacetylase/succinyl-diaminopimelate desuccinylase-like protein
MEYELMTLSPRQVESRFDWAGLPGVAARVIQHAIDLQQIPAPTFDEARRAAFLQARFEVLGLEQIYVDELHNVYGCIRGGDPARPAVLLSAHTDTVFEASTDLAIRRENGLIYGPGLGDNSIGVAGLVGLAEMLKERHLTPARDLWFVANTREEGLGDLGGMKAAVERLRGRISSVINVEGMAFGHVYHAGIAVRRLHVRAGAEGGHSWLNFGRASAVHGILQAGAKLTSLQPPGAPRTTFNIGLIDGGTSINTIASSASLWLDLRSEESAALAALEQEARAHINALGKPDLQFTIEVVGDRPAGAIPPEHPLVQIALASLDGLGVKGTLETGSTDANVPLSQGIPAVTVGITRGGNAHRLDEFIETAPVGQGMRHLFGVVLATAESNV